MTKHEILTNVYTQLRLAGYVWNKGDFAKRLDYFNSYMASAFTGKRQSHLNGKMFQRIQEVFPQVSANYLMNGEGPVLRTNRINTSFAPLPTVNTEASLLECLIAERETVRQSLSRIDQMIERFCPCDMRKAS